MYRDKYISLNGHYSSLDMIIRVYSSSMLIGKQIFGIIYTSKKIKT